MLFGDFQSLRRFFPLPLFTNKQPAERVLNFEQAGEQSGSRHTAVNGAFSVWNMTGNNLAFTTRLCNRRAYSYFKRSFLSLPPLSFRRSFICFGPVTDIFLSKRVKRAAYETYGASCRATRDLFTNFPLLRTILLADLFKRSRTGWRLLFARAANSKTLLREREREREVVCRS